MSEVNVNKVTDTMENKANNDAPSREDARKVMDRMAHGKLQLAKPMLSRGETVEEIAYDFHAVTSDEYVDAMDSDRGNNNPYAISSKQALALFAVAAAKEMPTMDAKDVLRQIGVQDALIAVRLAKAFFLASLGEGNMRILKE